MYKCYREITDCFMGHAYTSKHNEKAVYINTPTITQVCMGAHYPFTKEIEKAASEAGVTLCRTTVQFKGAHTISKDSITAYVISEDTEVLHPIENIIDWMMATLTNLGVGGIAVRKGNGAFHAFVSSSMVAAGAIVGKQDDTTMTVLLINIANDNGTAMKVHEDFVHNETGLNDIGYNISIPRAVAALEDTFPGIYHEILVRSIISNIEEWKDAVGAIHSSREWIENSNLDVVILPD